MKILRIFLNTVRSIFAHAPDNPLPTSQTNSQIINVNQETAVLTSQAQNNITPSENNGKINITVTTDSNKQNCNNKQSSTIIVVTFIVATAVVLVAFINK